MRLSEAIRIGGMFYPQGFSDSMDGDTRCAVAGACEVAGIPAFVAPSKHRLLNIGLAMERWPILERLVVPPPAMEMGRNPRSVYGVLWVLNDVRRWSPDQIADFVEGIERQDQPSGARIEAVVGEAV